MDCTEKRIDGEIKYKGVIVTVRLDRAQLVNGKIVKREVVEHPGGVTVLPVDENGVCTMVRQFRYPFGRMILEAPAGKLEPGENPDDAALRELKEETGAVPARFTPLGALIVSPGCYGEVLYLYLAEGLQCGAQSPDEDEFLDLARTPFDKMLARVLSGEVQDAKTVAGILKVYALRTQSKA